VEALPIRAAAGSDADPEGERVGGVGGDRRDAGEKKRGESDEATASRNGIDGAAQRAGGAEEDRLSDIQGHLLSRICRVSRIRGVRMRRVGAARRLDKVPVGIYERCKFSARMPFRIGAKPAR